MRIIFKSFHFRILNLSNLDDVVFAFRKWLYKWSHNLTILFRQVKRNSAWGVSFERQTQFAYALSNITYIWACVTISLIYYVYQLVNNFIDGIYSHSICNRENVKWLCYSCFELIFFLLLFLNHKGIYLDVYSRSLT